MPDRDSTLKDCCLTTAEIRYHLPDQPHLLQTLVWREFDVAPKFPALHSFLKVWSNSLDGAVHSVRVTHLDPARTPSRRGIPGNAVLH